MHYFDHDKTTGVSTATLNDYFTHPAKIAVPLCCEVDRQIHDVLKRCGRDVPTIRFDGVVLWAVLQALSLGIEMGRKAEQGSPVFAALFVGKLEEEAQRVV